ncbi:hypothetical protein D3C75_986770 [compost metagenome]
MIWPSFITQMRSPMVIASVWSCVTYTVVAGLPEAFSCLCRSEIRIRIEARSLASRLDNGSSNRNTSGFFTIARPTATRCA